MTAQVHGRRLNFFDRTIQRELLHTWVYQDTPMADLQRLAGVVWAGERLQRDAPRVVAGRGVVWSGWTCSYECGGLIVLARHQRRPGILLHEVAHAIIRGGYWHGPAFQKCFLHLLEKYGRVDPVYLHLTAGILGIRND